MASAVQRSGGGRVVSAGAAGIDRFVLGIFAWALLVFGNIYYSLAQRALDWTIDNIKGKTSLALSRSMAYHAEVQHAVAEMVMELEAIGPHIEKVAQDWSDGVDYGHGWGPRSLPLNTTRSRAHGKSSIMPWSWRVASGSSRWLGWSVCSAMHDLAVSTRLTRS
jgi:alkylation response protein AidB-like acyl-CoA dehydrogenase